MLWKRSQKRREKQKVQENEEKRQTVILEDEGGQGGRAGAGEQGRLARTAASCPGDCTQTSTWHLNSIKADLQSWSFYVQIF